VKRALRILMAVLTFIALASSECCPPCSVALAAEGAVASEKAEKNYWDRSKEGWFWYEKALKEKKPEKEKKVKLYSRPLDEKTLGSMRLDELKALAEDLKKLAIEEPDEYNVRRYLVVQKYLTDKAERFARMWRLVLLKHPELNPEAGSPPSEAGRAVLAEVERRKLEMTLKNLKGRAALVFFSRKGCPFCEKERSVLSLFEDRYGWLVKEVDVEQDPEVASAFGVTAVPDMWLIYRNPDDSPFYFRVRAGFATLSEVEEGIGFVYENAVKNPEINPYLKKKEGSKRW